MTMAGTSQTDAQGVRFPILQGILPVNRSMVLTDILAGMTLAALAIPQVMGYARIAGAPVITGLYTILIPMALFAIFGSSRRLVVGPTQPLRPFWPVVLPAWPSRALPNTWPCAVCWLSWQR